MQRRRQPRGTVILLSVFLILIMLIFGGLAIDIGGIVTARSELHRATDAAALAGAGKLGFDDTVFPTARSFAVTYAANNPTHFGTVTLSPNSGNALPQPLTPSTYTAPINGDVVLGVWDGSKRSFTPSLDGTQVNAVQCRTAQNVPMSFLRLIGITSIPMTALSIATSNPPNSPPGCVIPIGVTSCQFSPNGGPFSSAGCGTAMTFSSSSGRINDPITGTTSGTNTAAWINLQDPPGRANAPYLIPTINAAGQGTCVSNPVAGQPVSANNGMQNDVMDTFTNDFIAEYNKSSVGIVNDANGNPAYTGKGWWVYVPLIQTECPPKDINQTYTIQTFSRFVFTQVIHKKACVVNNPNDTNTAYICTHASDPSFPNEAIFGYFDCATLDTTPTQIPAPRAALATRLQLVQ